MLGKIEVTKVAVYWPSEGGYGQGIVCKTDADIERACREWERLGYGKGGKNSGVIHIIKETRDVRERKLEGTQV